MPVAPAPDLVAAAVAFDAQGLVPVVVQDAGSGGVRMVAWANRTALQTTAETGLAHFWSRSRQALWCKGETSGNRFHVAEMRVDCDGDVVLYRGHAAGPSCHTGRTSCFFRSWPLDGDALAEDDDGPPAPPAVIVADVAAVIGRRRRERPERSYVVSLLDAGWTKIGAKITEEARELVEALPAGDKAHIAHEAADALFHILVGLEAAGVAVDDVFGELRRRFGTSGIAEKESR